ncbi:MAG: hypothetical protein AB7K68_13820 [Bacteriovoracia bacterium]
MKILVLLLAFSAPAFATEDMPTYGRAPAPNNSYLALYENGVEKASYDVMSFSLQGAPARIMIYGARERSHGSCTISKELASSQGMSLGEIGLMLQNGISLHCEIGQNAMASSFWIYHRN